MYILHTQIHTHARTKQIYSSSDIFVCVCMYLYDIYVCMYTGGVLDAFCPWLLGARDPHRLHGLRSRLFGGRNSQMLKFSNFEILKCQPYSCFIPTATRALTSKNAPQDALGPGTVVGSATFNLYVITGLCMVALPTGETRKIDGLLVHSIQVRVPTPCRCSSSYM